MKKFATERYLKAVYLISGVYDLILGIASVIFADSFLDLFNVSHSDPPIFLQISGLFLITVGYFLIYSSQKPKEFVFIAVGSVFVRLSYALIIIVTMLSQIIEPFYVLFAITDGITGLIIILALVFTEDISFHQIWS
ncbi:MAG: hypothetical protein ACXADA_23880 [Candidatus Hodarchaeales archaeon]|jgi:hypothetical protein